MQSNQPFLPRIGKTMLPLDGVGSGYNNYDASARSIFDMMARSPGYNPSLPSQNVKLQLSEACPKNFVIFDQTDFRSQIMLHPAMASNFYPRLNINGTETINANIEDQEISSSQTEDSDDIDALMDLISFEEDESEDEEVSTARTDVNYGSSSPDSCSNYHKRSFVGGESCRKRKKMGKMVKTLRGIVPGANRMNTTVAVLDETVRYLKSLKVEVQKLGIKNLRS